MDLSKANRWHFKMADLFIIRDTFKKKKKQLFFVLWFYNILTQVHSANKWLVNVICCFCATSLNNNRKRDFSFFPFCCKAPDRHLFFNKNLIFLQPCSVYYFSPPSASCESPLLPHFESNGTVQPGWNRTAWPVPIWGFSFFFLDKRGDGRRWVLKWKRSTVCCETICHISFWSCAGQSISAAWSLTVRVLGLYRMQEKQAVAVTVPHTQLLFCPSLFSFCLQSKLPPPPPPLPPQWAEPRWSQPVSVSVWI